MCGLLFIKSKHELDKRYVDECLSNMSWRGPDFQDSILENNGHIYFGHCRLSILDPSQRSNQPMPSMCKRYTIIYNGEIYNHKELRKKLNIQCQTLSDTETIIEGYSKIGSNILNYLDGMFAFVIWDNLENNWFAARDHFGIKPLYIYDKNGDTVICSEPTIISKIVNARVSSDAIVEWKLMRRPIPGYSYFEDVQELLPATCVDGSGKASRYWELKSNDAYFIQEEFEDILSDSVERHQLSDVRNVCLLSGGIDSAIICALSKVSNCYTTGLISNNEVFGASETAMKIGVNLKTYLFEPELLEEIWTRLAVMRGEPLSVPNEGLIFLVCCKMDKDEKVVLTGEGADELLFGYDNIFRWGLFDTKIDFDKFIKRYSYSSIVEPTDRLLDYLNKISENKSNIEFLEDFFYDFHLPGLLRRMDFSSMAASKEARVPFVTRKLVEYMYRKPAPIKIDSRESKLPLRNLASKLGLNGALGRKKIGFSASYDGKNNRAMDYAHFQKVVLNALKW